jgi:hypothetical protein
MPDTDNRSTVSDLISHAKSHGYTVTPDQIAEWRRIGLLPSGDRPGRGQRKGRGRRSFEGDARHQLLALCRIHQHVRDLEEVGWWLWFEGGDVPEHFWRPALLEAAEQFDRYAPVIRSRLLEGNTAELTDVAFEVAKIFKERRTRNKLHRNVRKRLSDAEVETFLKCILRLCIGISPLTDPNADSEEAVRDETIMRNGLGLQRAGVEGSIREPLGDLAIALRFRDAKTLISRISPQLAAEARDEVHKIGSILTNAGRILERRHGKHAFGLGLVQHFFNPDRHWWAMLLALWISFGKRSQLRKSARRFLKDIDFMLSKNPAGTSEA